MSACVLLISKIYFGSIKKNIHEDGYEREGGEEEQGYTTVDDFTNNAPSNTSITYNKKKYWVIFSFFFSFFVTSVITQIGASFVMLRRRVKKLTSAMTVTPFRGNSCCRFVCC